VGGLGLKGTLSTVAGARVSTVVNFLKKGEGIGIRPEFVNVPEDWWERVDDLIMVLGDEVEPLRTWKSEQRVRDMSEDFEQQRWWNAKVMNCLAAASDKVGTPRELALKKLQREGHCGGWVQPASGEGCGHYFSSMGFRLVLKY
jgi:hypothetical protein